jgi:hypothetical protein
MHLPGSGITSVNQKAAIKTHRKALKKNSTGKILQAGRIRKNQPKSPGF